MFGHNNFRVQNDCVEIDELPFGRRDDMDPLLKITLIGAIAYVLYSIVLKEPVMMVPYNSVKSGASMVASVVKSASAKLGTVVDDVSVQDGGDVYKSMPKGVVKLIDYSNAGKDPDGWRSMTDDQKKKCSEKARNWLAVNKNAVIMIFAPWCDHCHN